MKPKIIAGPCQLESDQQASEIIEEMRRLSQKYDFDYVFKASYDKANRTSITSRRGRGFQDTHASFLKLKTEFPNLVILSDYHSVSDMGKMLTHYNDAVDVIQIPAFLSRQTDLLTFASGSGKIVNIKKSQTMSASAIAFIKQKCKDASELWITERGTQFGYSDYVVDYAGLQEMVDTGTHMVLDASHSLQKPNSGSITGGSTQYGVGLMKAAAAIGVRNFFLEVHPFPEDALSDGNTSYILDDLEEIVSDIMPYIDLNETMKREKHGLL